MPRSSARWRQACFAISRGLIIEPPAFLTRAADTAQRMVRAPHRRGREAGAMISTLAALFRHALPHHAGRGAARRVRADHPARLRRADAAHGRRAERLGAAGRQDFAVSRAADRRAHPAVLRADRRDVVLSRPVAPARTGGVARRRNVGLAVHRAGHRGRAWRRRPRHRGLQPDRRGPAGKGQAPGGGDFRQQRRGPAGDRQRLLGEPAQRQRPIDHQRRSAAASRACC